MTKVTKLSIYYILYYTGEHAGRIQFALYFEYF